MDWDYLINKKVIETWHEIIEETKDLSEIKCRDISKPMKDNSFVFVMLQGTLK